MIAYFFCNYYTQLGATHMALNFLISYTKQYMYCDWLLAIHQKIQFFQVFTLNPKGQLFGGFISFYCLFWRV